MKIHFLILTILSIFAIQTSYSSEGSENILLESFTGFTDGRQYLSYEFGMSKSIKVFVAEGDSICDVIICESGKPCISTTCEATSLLRWAFDGMADDVSVCNYLKDDEYKPYHYELALQKDNSRKVVLSSTMKISGSDITNERLEDLKEFMVSIWYSNIMRH